MESWRAGGANTGWTLYWRDWRSSWGLFKRQEWLVPVLGRELGNRETKARKISKTLPTGKVEDDFNVYKPQPKW